MGFVPESNLDTLEREGKNHVKIAITEHVSKSFELFVKGGPEAVIQLIRFHESIVKDCKFCNIYKSALALINMKMSAIQKLDATQDKVLIKEQNETIEVLKATCISTQQDAFDYFEQLLAEEHVPKWREIVEEQ